MISSFSKNSEQGLCVRYQNAYESLYNICILFLHILSLNYVHTFHIHSVSFQEYYTNRNVKGCQCEYLSLYRIYANCLVGNKDTFVQRRRIFQASPREYMHERIRNSFTTWCVPTYVRRDRCSLKLVLKSR